jgi:predicted nuclease of predicted toxin-antitoxin system
VAIKLLADMPISLRTVCYLREMGYEAVRADKLGMERAEDEQLLPYAAERDMVIITTDLDFAGFLAVSGMTKPSVITFRLRNPDASRINKMLEDMLPKLASEPEVGNIVTVEEERIRVRRLPIIK